MTAIRGARERARADITAAIKDEAKRRLAAEGAQKLSLRAVARELGMASSALYRYYPSREELLTALITDAYDAIGAAAEKAAGSAATAEPADRWAAVCQAVRAWALEHPHEYALIYGTPVPGYSAPEATIAPASRVGLVLISLARDAHTRGRLHPPAGASPLPAALHADAQRLAADHAPGLPAAVMTALVAAWAQLFGLISFELFGQFHRVVEAREAFFTQAVAGLAAGVGLRLP